MLSLLNAKYIGGYRINVNFSDNAKGVVDLTELVCNKNAGVFNELQDINKFKSFKINYTIIWNDKLDIAPEFLYFKAFEKKESLQMKFKEWGYI